MGKILHHLSNYMASYVLRFGFFGTEHLNPGAVDASFPPAVKQGTV